MPGWLIASLFGRSIKTSVAMATVSRAVSISSSSQHVVARETGSEADSGRWQQPEEQGRAALCCEEIKSRNKLRRSKEARK